MSPNLGPGGGALALKGGGGQRLLYGALDSGGSDASALPGGQRYLQGTRDEWMERMQGDAAAAFRDGKYAKAEYYLRQILNMTVKEKHLGDSLGVGGRPPSGSRPGSRAGGSRPGTGISVQRRGEDGESEEMELPEAPIMYRLAQCLRYQGHLREDEDMLRKALAMLEEADGPDAEATRGGLLLATGSRAMLRYRILTDLGSSVAKRAGDAGAPEEALALAERAVFLAERLYGPTAGQVVEPMLRVAGALSRLSRYEEAEKKLQTAHTLRCRTHGERHPETGKVLCMLAQTYKRLGQFERAARYDALWRKCPSAERYRHTMRDPVARQAALEGMARSKEAPGTNLGLAIVSDERPLGRTRKLDKWRGVVPKMDFSRLPEPEESSDEEEAGGSYHRGGGGSYHSGGGSYHGGGGSSYYSHHG